MMVETIINNDYNTEAQPSKISPFIYRGKEIIFGVRSSKKSCV
jgi:hypothetical protein